MAGEEELVERFEDLHIHLQLSGTKLFRGDQCVGTGVLTIDEYEVNWAGGNDDKVCLSYPEICLHAVSRDTSSFPHPCLYLLTCPLQEDGSEGDEEDTEGETVEMRLVLENNDNLDRLFETISEGQSLHPDPEDVSTEEEEGEDEPASVMDDIQPLDEGAGFFRTVEDLQYLSPEGQRTLEHIEQLLAGAGNQPQSAQNGDSEHHQFEDAAED